jgi:hypothetical protein
MLCQLIMCVCANADHLALLLPRLEDVAAIDEQWLKL